MLLLLILSTFARVPRALAGIGFDGGNKNRPKVTKTVREVLDKQGNKRTLVTCTTTYYA